MTNQTDAGSDGGSPPPGLPDTLQQLLEELNEVDPLMVLRYYAQHGSTEQTRISAAKSLAEYDHHKLKSLGEGDIEDSHVKINMNLDTDVPDNSQLPSEQDGQGVSQ